MYLYFRRQLFLGFLFVFSFLSLNAQQERILNYEVNIQIQKDRSIKVIEDLYVYAAGQKIKRGIRRDFPLQKRYKGKTSTLDYNIISVTKDFKEEPYHTNSSGNNLSLYIGNKNVYLSPNEYRYSIEYEVPRQIGFFDNYDELYWNAIGSGWDFQIENASCTVTLPSGAKLIQKAC